MASSPYYNAPAEQSGGYPFSYGAQGSDKFPNPFFDISSTFMPTELHTLFELAEYMYMTFGTWRMASKRVVRYFLTEIILEGESDSEREKLDKVLSDDIKLLSQIGVFGDNFMAYGNGLIGLLFPFDRYLVSPAKAEYAAEKIDYKFNFETGKFRGYCPKAKKEVDFKVIDRRSPEAKRIKLKHWNPKEIFLRVHPLTGDTEYYWKIPERLCKNIRKGIPFYLNKTPMAVVNTIRNAKSGIQPLFKLDERLLYHLKDDVLAGVPIEGWGIPPIMANFKLAYYIQVLRRFDEAIALDFIMPFRVIYPDYGPSPSKDPLKVNSMNVFRSMMQTMVQEHRKDPTWVQIAPYKVGYEMIGGEGQQLTPKEQLAMAHDELLNAMGYPAELYKGTLSIQAFPVALRLFERTWGCLVDGLNDVVSWSIQRICQYMGWGQITGKLRSVTLADDIERKALNLQAAAGMDISKGTAYTPFGLDYLEEQKRLVEEQVAIQRLQQEAMEESMAAGGQGSDNSGAPAVGATPGDVYAQSQALAQQLLFQTPESMRRGELIKIKQSNPTLHALVLQQMDQMRYDMKRQGGAAMMEQQKADMGAAGGGMVATASNSIPESGWEKVGHVVMDAMLSHNEADLKKIALSMRSMEASDPSRLAFHYIYRTMKGWPVTMKQEAA